MYGTRDSTSIINAQSIQIQDAFSEEPVPESPETETVNPLKRKHPTSCAQSFSKTSNQKSKSKKRKNSTNPPRALCVAKQQLFGLHLTKVDQALHILYLVLEGFLRGKTLVVVNTTALATDIPRITQLFKLLAFRSIGLSNKTKSPIRQEHLAWFHSCSRESRVVCFVSSHLVRGIKTTDEHVVALGFGPSTLPELSSRITGDDQIGLYLQCGNTGSTSLRALPFTWSKESLDRSRIRLGVASKCLATETVSTTRRKLDILLVYPLIFDKTRVKEKFDVTEQKVIALNYKIRTDDHGGTRLAAQTQWIDRQEGHVFGGAWTGSIRYGASKDTTSCSIQLEQTCATSNGASTHWNPNPGPILANVSSEDHMDEQEEPWGRYGKVCGHNEIVMHRLRPFYPQEVLNSRVCSQNHPAPGNRGFQGCLEYLKLQCQAAKESMTLWDHVGFHYIDAQGQLSSIDKTCLISFSLRQIQFIMVQLRQWTIYTKGKTRPIQLLRGIELVMKLEERKKNTSFALVMNLIHPFVFGNKRV